MRKLIVLVIVFALVGAIGWQVRGKLLAARATSGKGGGGPGNNAAVAVEVTPVRQALVRELGNFTGSLAPRSRFIVAPKVGGRLEKLTVDVGDLVKSGQVLAELDAAEYAQQVEQARADVAVAKASVAECKSALDVARRDLDRVRALHEKKVASDSERDEAEAKVAAAEAKHQVSLAEVTRQEAALKAAEVRLAYTRVHVAWDATELPRVVGERYVDEGAMLKANDPIVTIQDHSAMIAFIDIIERDYSKIKLGQPAVVATDAYPGREFTGTIVRIAPLLRETSRQASVQVEIPNAEQLLKPGMFVRVQLEFARQPQATVVPAAALVRREGKVGVFLADPEKSVARFVPLRTGIADGDVTEVIEPPLAGAVVTMGHHLLEDGTTIRLPEPAAPDGQPAGGERRRREGGAR